jgi:Raf kinase inhibitor-like YbhB/YbcL family protein
MLSIATLTVRSSTFSDGGRLPLSAVFNDFGHSGGNRSPHLAWNGIGFAHWVLFDIPPSVSELPEDAERGRLPAGAKRGLSDLGTPGYVGPAPPPGSPHRYMFTVYALTVPTLGLGDTVTLALLRFVVRDKKLAEGRITGLYGVETMPA